MIDGIRLTIVERVESFIRVLVCLYNQVNSLLVKQPLQVVLTLPQG